MPTDLIARVEAAEGPDRGLDADIELALGNWTPEHHEAWHRFQECGEAANPPFCQPVDPQRLTGSLDAAMTLVPEGCLFVVRTVWDKMKPAGFGSVSIYEKGEFGGHERLYWMAEHQAVAATPALALCAAALRARAMEANDGQ